MQFMLRAAGIATLASTALGAGIAQAQEPQYDPNYEPPRTPWGDPDLQGEWPGTDMMGVPQQRPTELGARAELTEEEFADRQEAVARQEAAQAEVFVAPREAGGGRGTGGGPGHSMTLGGGAT